MDKEIFEVPAQDTLPPCGAEPTPKPVKAPRKKREMTPEQKAALLERLRKGRETAQANRKSKKATQPNPIDPQPQKSEKKSGQAKASSEADMLSVSHHGGGMMMAEVKALRAELAELRADKAESRRRKAEERMRKAQTEAKPEPRSEVKPEAKPEVKPVVKAAPRMETPKVVETEQYFDASTGQIKTRPKRK